MNCVNHPDVPVAAYCQSCGKALCQECVRSIGGVVYCEACLAARLNQPGVGMPGSGIPGAGMPGGAMPKAPGGTQPFVGLPPLEGPNPGLALGLGFIPGVGAMYNGQFVKGFAHVLVFALLCSFASREEFFGWLIPFWIAYQVFDAYQTAKARRDGTPLPNPFGFNDLGNRLGLQQHPEGTHVPPPYAGAYQAGTQPGPGSPFVSSPYTGSAPFAGAGPDVSGNPEGAPFRPVGEGPDPYTPPVSGFVPQPGSAPGVPFAPAAGTFGHAGVPVGAVILIGLGVLFLLGSLGIFRDEWLGRAWPLVLIGIGVWIIYRRTREVQGGRGL